MLAEEVGDICAGVASEPDEYLNVGEVSTMAKSQGRHSSLVHLAGGGLGGSVGAFVTCPLEVIQTRLQSSAFRLQRSKAIHLNVSPALSTSGGAVNFSTGIRAESQAKKNNFRGIIPYGRCIVKEEGFRALFKGLGPTLLGVTPSRAIYFAIYSKTKDILNHSSHMNANSAPVHMTSAALASFVNHTVTNPLWFIKTRLQLDSREGKRISALQLVRDSYKNEGIRAFYRGLTASYVGISETVIHFTIYEHIREKLLNFNYKTAKDFNVLECMMAAGISKSIATSLCYPHEVARTRLRQQESELHGERKYRNFFQALKTVVREEGWRGLYGGLGTHLIRQIPNTAIVFCTYEGVVYFLDSGRK